MKCEDLLQALNEYVDDKLDAKICEEYRQHLESCNPCQVVIDNIRKTITLYKADQPYPLPAAFHDCLHQALREKWRQTHGQAGRIG